MPNGWFDEPAARLANVIDLTSAGDWTARRPVFAMLHHRPGATGDIRFLSRPLDGPIPQMVASVAVDDECLAMAISAVFPPEQRRHGAPAGQAARLTVAVCDLWAVAIYRYRNGLVRRSDAVSAELRAEMRSLWQLRVRYELTRPATPAA